jgi:hypothetical protein
VGAFAANLLQLAFLAIWLLVLGRVFLSWFDPAELIARYPGLRV